MTEPMSGAANLQRPSLSKKGRRRKKTYHYPGTAWLMVAPAVLFFCVFVFYPVVNAIYVSFTSWDLVSAPKFIGFRNYIRLFSDKSFLNSALVTIYYTLILIALELPLALGLAILLDRKIKARGLYQAIIFAPAVLTMVAVAMIWRVVYTPVGGLYLMFTEPFGIAGLQWLNDKDLAMPAVLIVSVWKNVGYYMVIFLAGLQAIPTYYYEAARMDGAGSWKLFRHITLPLLKPFILFVMVVSIIRASQAFSLFYSLTNGGPASATKVLPYLIYEVAFGFNRMGYASAMAVVMFGVLLILTAIQFRVLRPQS